MAYEYDDANRLTSVTDWDLNETVYAYDDADRMTSATLPNGVVTTYGYDDADRLLSVDHDLGMTPIASVAYTLNAVGNRTQRVDDLGTHTYTYDDLHRLTEVTYPGPEATTYDLDAFGNRESMTDASGTTTYAYDDAERLTTVTPPSPASPVTYSWDDNGNLTARGTDTFEWDYEDRMVEAEVDSVVTTFEYRGDGLRDSATVGMNTTTYTWDIAAGLPVVLQEDDVRYIWGAHGLIAQVDGSDDWHYYHADGVGSTIAVTDDVGTVEQTYEYDVYGAVTGGSGSFDNSFQFAGEQVDASTGLQYLRARYYDLEAGRFISRDLLSTGAGWDGSPFGYAAAQPTILTDPLGLCPRFTPGALCDVGSAIKGGAQTVGAALQGDNLFETAVFVADVLPIAETCFAVATIGSGGNFALGFGAYGGCQLVEEAIGLAATYVSQVNIASSECRRDRRAGATAANLANFRLDLKGRFRPFAEAAEVGSYVASARLLDCGATAGSSGETSGGAGAGSLAGEKRPLMRFRIPRAGGRLLG